MKIKNINPLAARAAGFSIVEMVFSISVIAMLIALFTVNYHNTDKRSHLNAAKQKLVSDIRLAQNYALGSKTYDGVNTPKGGWGAHFDLSQPTGYLIFADKNEPNGNRAYDAGEEVETKNFPAGVTISSLSPANTVDVVFFPPDPKTYVNGADDASAVVTLRENVNNSTASVSVNFFGLIEAQ